jgi:methionine-rich copper-binding protein CopC
MTRIGILATAAALALATAADAHPRIKSAGPAPGSAVEVSPKALRIKFNEPVELSLSGIDVTNAMGKKQALGALSTAPNDKAQLIVPLKNTLAPGKYTVAWHAVGDDTHRVKGTYSFTVKKAGTSG